MRVLSLFSGGGLGDFGIELVGMQIVGQVEIDEFCQKILKLRWPHVPKWGDIKLVTGKEIIERIGPIDIICGGPPCQPFSLAGKRKGVLDERNLWPEMFRLICEIKPRWVLVENVVGLLSMDAGRVFGGILRDLASRGYVVEWDCIPACALGAPHQRDRVWVLAYAERNSHRFQKRSINAKKNCVEESKRTQHGSAGQPGGAGTDRISHKGHEADSDADCMGRKERSGKRVQPIEQMPVRQDACDLRKETPDTAGEGLERHGQLRKDEGAIPEERISVFGAARKDGIRPTDFWAVEPSVGRLAHGIANRVDRLKLLGNGQVVQIVEWIGKIIMEFEKN